MEMYASSAPTRLDDLLQVPLKVIPLQDLLREKASSVSPPSNKNSSTSSLSPASASSVAKDRLCRSADSQSPLGKEHSHNKKPISLSSPCLFDCCSQPSRWGTKGPYSNNAKFRSAELKLPDGSTAVIPVMDCNEETLSDIEMKELDENFVEKARRNFSSAASNLVGLDLSRQIMRSRSRSNSDEVVETSPPSRRLPLAPQPQPPPVPEDSVPSMPKPRRGRPPGSGPHQQAHLRQMEAAAAVAAALAQQSQQSHSHSTPQVVMGKVMENPTRYKDFIVAQGQAGSMSERNNNNYKEITKAVNNLVPIPGPTGQKDDPITVVDGESSSELRDRLIDSDGNTLKLTFYNDGRKQSVKEFRTSSNQANILGIDREGIPEGVMERERAIAGIAEQEKLREESYYFQNRHGLQLSRVMLRNNEEHHNLGKQGEGSVMGGGDGDDGRWVEINYKQNAAEKNVGNSSVTVNAAARALVENLEKEHNRLVWEQGLQISRCQKETPPITGRVAPLERELGAVGRRGSNSQEDMERGNSPGESENNLINKHLQSVLTSLRYIKPTGATGNSTVSVTSPALSSHSANSAIQPISPPSRNSSGHGQQQPQIAAKVPMGKLTPSRTVTVPISPPTQHHPQMKQIGGHSSSAPVTASGEPWHERTIARIPTRPSLLKNHVYEVTPQTQAHSQASNHAPNHSQHPQQIQHQQQQLPQQHQRLLHEQTSSTMHSPAKRMRHAGPLPPPNIPVPVARYQQSQSQHPHHNILPRSIQTGNGNLPSNYLNERPGGLINYGSAHHPQHQNQHSGSIQSNSYINRHQQQQPPHPPQQHQNSHHQPTVNIGRGMNVPVPFHSPNMNEHLQNHQSPHGANRMHDSLMVAAAIAVNASTTEPLSQTEYYDRLRSYYEYYQRQQLDMPKFAEYYQKVSNIYPSPPGREHQIQRVEEIIPRQSSIWRTPQSQTQQQHQQIRHTEELGHLIANATTGPHPGIMSGIPINKPPSTYTHNIHHSAAAAHQARQIVDISPPEESPPSQHETHQIAQHQQIRGVQPVRGYNASHNQSQQQHHQQQRLQDLRQMQERQRQLQLQDQQQRYSHHQAYQQQLQQQQNSQSRDKILPVVQGNVQQSHRGANQYSHYDNNNIVYLQQHAQQLQHRSSNREPVRELVREPISASESHLETSRSSVNQHQITTVRNNSVAHHQNQQQHPQGQAQHHPRALSPLTHIPNFHRQTLELAIKNNFKMVSNESIQNGNEKEHHSTSSMPSSRQVMPISSPGNSHSAPVSIHSQPNYTRGGGGNRDWPKELNSNIRDENKDRGRQSPSAIVRSVRPIAQQTSVIRRITQAQPPQLKSPESNITSPSNLQNSSIISQKPSQTLERANNNAENYSKIIQNRQQQHRYNNNNHQNQNHQNSTGSERDGGNGGIIKRRIQIVREGGDYGARSSSENNAVDVHQHQSPIPLVAGEEEVTTDTSPSEVLTTINPVESRNSGKRRRNSGGSVEGEEIRMERNSNNDGGKGDGPRNENNNDDNERHSVDNNQNDNEHETDLIIEHSERDRERRGRSGRDHSGSGEEGGLWQYDHVVLLDKRTKTHMCKRCYEILKNEQDIRNHLFCKMLAGYVRCHVCLQLLKSEEYSGHLQIHGVRPPGEECSEDVYDNHENN